MIIVIFIDLIITEMQTIMKTNINIMKVIVFKEVAVKVTLAAILMILEELINLHIHQHGHE